MFWYKTYVFWFQVLNRRGDSPSPMWLRARARGFFLILKNQKNLQCGRSVFFFFFQMLVPTRTSLLSNQMPQPVAFQPGFSLIIHYGRTSVRNNKKPMRYKAVLVLFLFSFLSEREKAQKITNTENTKVWSKAQVRLGVWGQRHLQKRCRGLEGRGQEARRGRRSCRDQLAANSRHRGRRSNPRMYICFMFHLSPRCWESSHFWSAVDWLW